MASSSTGVDTVSEQFMDELVGICKSKDLSIEALQAKIKLLPSHTLSSSAYEHLYPYRPFFHTAIMNRNITLEIVEYLLEVFPRVENLPTAYFCQEETTTSYALHCACDSECCPNEVVKLLAKKCSIALDHFCLIWEGLSYDDVDNIGGLPLHYYLARKSNVDIDTVKTLVEAYPQSLGDFDDMVDDMSFVPPIHVIVSNKNIKIDDLYGIITFFIQQSSQIMRMRDTMNSTPLHKFCMNERLTLELFQLVFNAWPEAIRSRDNGANLPIHELCCNEQLDDTASLDILRFMLSVDPTVLRETGEDGYLPAHDAVAWKSFAFCKKIIDEYPESMRIGTNYRQLPIHEACQLGSRDDKVDTIEYMLGLYPECLYARDRRGWLPIHGAAENGNTKTIELLLMHDPTAASKETTGEKRELPLHIACRGVCGEHVDTVNALFDAYPEAVLTRNENGWLPIHGAAENGNTKTIELLLMYDPSAASKETTGGGRSRCRLPLHIACLHLNGNTSAVQVLYDAYPEAILTRNGNGETPIDLAEECGNSKVLSFLKAQVLYVRKAQDMTSMTTPDENGWLPLHHALKGSAPLGSIKLLVKGNLSAVRTTDNNMAFPLHSACEFSSAKVAKLLVEKYERSVDHCDDNKDSILHYACRGGNLGVRRFDFILEDNVRAFTGISSSRGTTEWNSCEYGI